MSKFLDGFKFGLGFGLAFLATLYVGLGFVLNRSASNFASEGFPTDSSSRAVSVPDAMSEDLEGVSFYELDLEEQIKRSTAIAFAEFRRAEDGKNVAIITEFLKKTEGVEIRHEVGEEHRPSSFYPRDDVTRGDGVVIFFTGSPATMQMSMTYNGDRISGLGDMPMQLFRAKCEPSDA